eukprot:NODE_1251_length_1038_cov_219.782609_g959_i0.p1 GENE.NODE_1251_length_1038_cov_219.782609_g959_i0~~NODE_1251_length_1038_cov_219.782609_g959_i0.p1  ORF type:complete len:142 (-),score=14.40 NODE_1251_length_1038_cov_219.782609_g959_i0:340-765(-)
MSPKKTVTLNKECANYKMSDFINDVKTHAKIDVVVHVWSCGSIGVTYACPSWSGGAAATSACTTLAAQLNDPNSAVSKATGALSTNRDLVRPSNDSNKGLFALFVLLLIPIAVVVAYFIADKSAEDEGTQPTTTAMNSGQH